MEDYFSFVIPVYNRPDEIQELLNSFIHLDYNKPFEVVIVEDGSTIPCEAIVAHFKEQLNISYFFKSNSGPGDSRNFGMKKAKGTYFIILDSDCLLPPHYLNVISNFLSENYTECFGGADAAHQSFSNFQKAISYVMTSFWTTGGIRGSRNAVQKFEPRSFNMGLSKKAFEVTGGFSDIHPGEDPDLSQRILKAGFKTCFVPNAYVYHKRRISWGKFYKQVHKFGKVRPILNRWHPESSKVTFWFPSMFIVFVLASMIVGAFISPYALIPIGFYMTVLFLDCTFKNKNPYIGLLSIVAMFVQFFGYGFAFIRSWYNIQLLNKNPRQQYPELFFK
ncbi:MAG: glycosyltransferase [Flavobacteriaceae bacterium]